MIAVDFFSDDGGTIVIKGIDHDRVNQLRHALGENQDNQGPCDAAFWREVVEQLETLLGLSRQAAARSLEKHLTDTPQKP